MAEAPAWGRYASTHSNNSHVREVLQKQSGCIGRVAGFLYVGENGRMEPAQQPESVGGASPNQVWLASRDETVDVAM